MTSARKRQQAGTPKVKFRKFDPDALVRERERAEMSRVEVAYLIGRSNETIYQWETGRSGEHTTGEYRTGQPRTNDLSALAKVLSCSIEDLLTKEES